MKVLFLFVLVMMTSCVMQDENKFYMPAEWEPHDAIWLGWEDDQLQYRPAVVKIIKALKAHVKIKIAVSDDSLMRVAKKYLQEEGIDPSQLQFYNTDGAGYWIRDFGATFLVNGKGQIAVAGFGWNRYGYPGWLEIRYDNNRDSISKYLMKHEVKMKLTDGVDSLMAVVEGASTLRTDVKHEGGATEVNGKGTLILCEATVFQRNPGRSKEELESEFKRVLGVTNIIWMKKGLADDPLHFFRRISNNYVGGGTGGHTDEFVRFANANTILLAWIEESEKDLNPVNQMNYDRMNENFKILAEARDQDGQAFAIVKVPLPDLIVKEVTAKENIDGGDWDGPLLKPSYFPAKESPTEGDTLLRVPAASYLNYLVTNRVVLLPTYTAVGSSAEKENEVKRIFQEQFPEREIVFIDAMPQNWQGGGIHCSTQQQPARK
ncbi:MAG TPA: agmatine deiminase family protein [Chryseolinea sp.]|nr:agmatine deiminase family protein [Chryseolinea sp.]